jgi:hypothetical protein
LCVPLLPPPPPPPHPLFRPNPQIYYSKNYIPEFFSPQTNNMSNPTREIIFFLNLKKNQQLELCKPMDGLGNQEWARKDRVKFA